MDRAVNDATFKKMGDIFQYYVALKDCFKMGMSDKLQIEVNGDVSVIAELSKDSFQKEVKHHLGKKKLGDRDVDFWKTLSNWYIEYDRITSFTNLVLYTTASVSSNSAFYGWNNKTTEEKILLLKSIGNVRQKKEETFRNYYDKIFNQTLYDENKLSDILRRFTIESSQTQIVGISGEFSCFIGYIPEKNRDSYIGALLGRVLALVKEPPHRWEVTRKEFDAILQQEAPAYINPLQVPLPVDYAEMDVPEQNAKSLLQKHFVEEIKKIKYDTQIPDAISDYWKAEMTIMRYFKNDFLYLRSLPEYKNGLEKKLKYTKEGKVIEAGALDRDEQIKHSKLMYTNVMAWDAKDFGSIIRNQEYFQRGIIHTIVDDKKFSWDIGEDNEQH